ncbi:uncharacterized protein [Palaemon carinicauda]|uniref:uncharacterized protein n=1 Tax=Palaemon carinicauda TaxID=392227 RepID=UPI0035B66FD4
MMKYLITGLVLLYSIYLAQSLKCYEGAPGKTKENPNCTFSCQKSIDKASEVEVIMYGCSDIKHDEDECKDIEDIAKLNTIVKTECFCNTDLCNSTATISSSLSLLLVALFMKIAF